MFRVTDPARAAICKLVIEHFADGIDGTAAQAFAALCAAAKETRLEPLPEPDAAAESVPTVAPAPVAPAPDKPVTQESAPLPCGGRLCRDDGGGKEIHNAADPDCVKTHPRPR